MPNSNPPSSRPMTLRQQLLPVKGRYKKKYCMAHKEEGHWTKDCPDPKLFQSYKSSRQLFDGNREIAIQRDGEKCVKCGMTRVEHKERYGRDITVDHIDRMGSNVKRALKNNALYNLQTLCFPCHAYKDQRNVVGTNNSAAKLTEQDVLDIRMFIAKGINLVDISRVYPVTLGTICNIRAGRIWKHLL